ncbi:sortase A [Paenarthrobacter nicotinovorans]|uniref:class C sortase n=1 Tax=Micrococcaceae TaxID=1268 RepID=UPI000876D094|nr:MULTISPECIES: class C sortase [Micrococcaceae]MDR6438803.1 sortase A [Paenarthrobacter nicotinovorans]SCZ56256.1 sortase A [Arthrobacter sp. UNCCL28]
MKPKQTNRLRPRSTRRRAWTGQRLFIIFAAVIGVGILLYPTAAAWFSDRVHATEISGYADTVENLAPSAQDSLLEKARAFNAALPSGPLRDPYSLNDDGGQIVVGAGSETYKNILDVGPNGMMGRISIPSIHSDLPVFHGTDEETLSKGIGHLFGSGLPVGGTDTHSVLTGHSGFVNSRLFDNLDKVKTGDVFSITVLGKAIYYEVDQILTVKPEDTEALRKIAGQDLVTLVTCTPKGVNSHRLLVRGKRVDAPSEDQAQAFAGQTLDPGFPWWTLGLCATAALAVLVTRPRQQGAGRGVAPNGEGPSGPEPAGLYGVGRSRT